MQAEDLMHRSEIRHSQKWSAGTCVMLGSAFEAARQSERVWEDDS